MNNLEVQTELSACTDELEIIRNLLVGYGHAANPTLYVTRYGVIRATGAIESGFKKIIADRVDEGSHDQVKHYIKKNIRESSCNPRLGKIEEMISAFDSSWRRRFDEQIALSDKPTLSTALTELCKARNSFAHGGVAVLDIGDTIRHFNSGKVVLEILDEAVNFTDE